MKTRIGACILLVTMFLPSVGWTSDDEDKEATAAFTKGIGHFQDGEFSQAADAFRRANSIKFNWKILYNIAQSEAAAKRYGLALQTFEEYLARGGDDVPVERRDEVFSEVKRLREMVGYIDVKGPPTAVINVDGVKRDKIPMTGPVIVSAGVTHDIAVLLDGEPIVVRSVRVTGQQTFTLDANEGSAERDDKPEGSGDGGSDGDRVVVVGDSEDGDGGKTVVVQEKELGKPLMTAGWVVLGVGAASLITGAVTGIFAVSKSNSLEDKYGGLDVPSDAQGDVDTVNNLATASNITLIAGGVLAATGAVLLIVGAKKRETNVSVAPVVGKSLAGMAIGGRF